LDAFLQACWIKDYWGMLWHVWAMYMSVAGSWYILIYIDIYWNILIYFSTYWYILIYIDILNEIIFIFWIYLFFFRDFYKRLNIYFDVWKTYWIFSIYIDIYIHMLKKKKILFYLYFFLPANFLHGYNP
jgi:hypothetical protein